MTTTQEAQRIAVARWQEATEAVEGVARQVTASEAGPELFEKIKDVRSAEREAWKRCRPFLAQQT